MSSPEPVSNRPATDRNDTRERLLADYDILHSWSAVGRKYDVTSAMAWRVAKEEGYEPKDKEIRKKLGGYPEIEMDQVIEMLEELEL